MAKRKLDTLKDEVRRSNPGRGASQRRTFYGSFVNVLDSTFDTATGTGLTVSESGVVTIEIDQPAKSILEEVTVVCTSEASIGSAAALGFRVGTTAGGQDIITGGEANTASIHAATTTIGAGTGSSTLRDIQASLDGASVLEPITVNTPFSSTQRTLYAQISCSTDAFDDNVGEFAVAVKYIRL